MTQRIYGARTIPPGGELVAAREELTEVTQRVDSRAAEVLKDPNVQAWLSTTPDEMPNAVGFTRASAKVQRAFTDIAAGRWNEIHVRYRLAAQFKQSPAFQLAAVARVPPGDKDSRTDVAFEKDVLAGRLEELFRIAGQRSHRSRPDPFRPGVSEQQCPVARRRLPLRDAVVSAIAAKAEQRLGRAPEAI